MIKVRYDEITGKIGKSYPELMDVPQPFVEMSEADHDELRAIILKDGEDLFFRNVGFVVEKDLEKEKQVKNAEILQKYNGALKMPISSGVYFVLPEWAEIYTMLYTAMQDDIDDPAAKEDELQKIRIITSLIPLAVENILMDFNTFQPIYRAVKKEFRRLTDKKHTYEDMVANGNIDFEIDYSNI